MILYVYIYIMYSGGFFDRSCSLNHRKSRSLISLFHFGLPIGGYTSWWDRQGEQRAKIRSWIGKLEPMLRHYDKGGLGFRVLREGGDIINIEVQDVLLHDAAWSIASVIFVFLYIVFHTRSIWMATCAMIGILLLSFPPTIYMCKLLFGNAMSLMNVVSLWLVTGNGADDIFVFVDIWNQVLYISLYLCIYHI